MRRFWTASEVRLFCIENDLYTKGDNESYGRMLDFVRNHKHPSDEDVRKVVIDLVVHSEGMDLYSDDCLLTMEAMLDSVFAK